MEVRRALHQNSMCRAPLLSTQHSKAELAELYRLHLQQAEVPADFGTLLQLRWARTCSWWTCFIADLEVRQQLLTRWLIF